MAAHYIVTKKHHLNQPEIHYSKTLVNRSLTKASKIHNEFKIAQNLLKPSLMASSVSLIVHENNKLEDTTFLYQPTLKVEVRCELIIMHTHINPN